MGATTPSSRTVSADTMKHACFWFGPEEGAEKGRGGGGGSVSGRFHTVSGRVYFYFAIIIMKAEGDMNSKKGVGVRIRVRTSIL